MSQPTLEIQLQTLPHQPGVYQYYDANGKILYVGKAKDLKKRVSSYFTKNHDYGKTKVLVKKIVTIKHIVVETETDALLLENNLIKKYQPKYNINLKDFYADYRLVRFVSSLLFCFFHSFKLFVFVCCTQVPVA